MKLTFGLIAWWLVWLCTSIWLKYENSVSEKTVVLIVIMCVGLLTGSVVGVFTPKLKLINARGFESTFGFFLKSIVVLQFIWIIYIYQINKINFSDVRSIFFYQPEILGGHKFVVYLYIHLLIPAYVFVNCYFLACNNFSRIFKFSLLFACFDVLICAGRFTIYYFIFFQAYSVIKNNFERAAYLFLGGATILLLSFSVYTLRYGAGISFDYLSYVKYLEKSLIYYHTAPFYLLSKLLDEYQFESSGYMSLGFADYVFYLLFPEAGKSDFALVGDRLNNIIVYIDGNTYNAFSTIIFPVYYDFNMIGVFIYFGIMGFFLGWSSKARNGNSSTLEIFLVFILFFGLFMPVNTSSLFFMTLFFVITNRLLRVRSLSNSTS